MFGDLAGGYSLGQLAKSTVNSGSYNEGAWRL